MWQCVILNKLIYVKNIYKNEKKWTETNGKDQWKEKQQTEKNEDMEKTLTAAWIESIKSEMNFSY